MGAPISVAAGRSTEQIRRRFERPLAIGLQWFAAAASFVVAGGHLFTICGADTCACNRSKYRSITSLWLTQFCYRPNSTAG